MNLINKYFLKTPLEICNRQKNISIALPATSIAAAGAQRLRHSFSVGARCRALGNKAFEMVENHHNFAWKEIYNGREVIVHRKGATPAGRNVPGTIPGSMTTPGFIVKGKGEKTSLNSASHGAGRKMSRTAALKSITQNALREELQKHRVKLLGGGLDEAPFAYKNIEEVMKSQKHLVDIIGKFSPKIVKMDGSAPKHWRKKSNEVIGE